MRGVVSLPLNHGVTLSHPAPRRRVILIGFWLLSCTTKGEQAAQLNGPPADLRARSAALYEAYGRALATGDRAAIAGFYHPSGAIIVFNGEVSRRSREAIDARYRGPWTPPVYFAWTSLAFDSIAAGTVIVTGGFQWQSAGRPDTSTYLYAATLQATDSGMAIRVEHETAAPSP